MHSKKMTIWEVEQFLNQTTDVEGGRSLSDAWDMTVSDLPFNKETLLGAILMKGGELAPVFNNVATMYKMSMWWWNKWLPTFEDWWIVNAQEYNPLWNKDYKETEHTDTEDAGTASTVTKNDETTHGETAQIQNTQGSEHTTDNVDVESEKSGNSFTENRVSAFDAPSNNSYVPHDTSSTEYSEDKEAHSDETIHTNRSETQDGAGTADTTSNFNGNVDGTTTNDRDFDREFWGRGNIGITSSQDLYGQEFETKFKYNPYELMSDIFIKELTDGVWI